MRNIQQHLVPNLLQRLPLDPCIASMACCAQPDEWVERSLHYSELLATVDVDRVMYVTMSARPSGAEKIAEFGVANP